MKHMILKPKQIYIFNPEHDLCIANGDENFVPPRSAMGFAKENTDLSAHLERPNKQRRPIIPWGWNHSLKKRLIRDGVDPSALPSEYELQFIRTHSRREFALRVHSRLTCGDSKVMKECAMLFECHHEGVVASPIFIPVSEINLRMTMGLIARNRYDREEM